MSDMRFHEHLKTLREAAALSQSEVARKLGVTKSAVSKWESAGGYKPKTEHMIGLAHLYGISAADLFEAALGTREKTLAEVAPSNVILAPHRVPRPEEMPRDLPLHGTLSGTIEGFFEVQKVLDMRRRPAVLANNERAYCLYIEGDSMAPRHGAGDLVVVDPVRPAKPGESVIVKVQHEGIPVPQCQIKTLIKADAGEVVVAQLNPPQEQRIPRASVIALERILTTEELLSG